MLWLCVQCASIYILADLCLYIWTCIYKVHFINVWKSWLWILIVVLPLKFIAEYIEIWSEITYLFGVYRHHNTSHSTQGFLYITLYKHYVELNIINSKYSLYINVYMHRHNKLSDRILPSLCMGNEKVFRFVRVVDIRIHFLHLWQIYYP